MTDYIFKTHGVDKKSRALRSITMPFSAPSDQDAVRQVETTIAPEAKDVLISCENAELVRADGEPVGVFDMNALSWQMGDVPHDDRPCFMGYSRNQMKPAFDLIKNAEHWKYPFDAIVPANADKRLIEAAAGFFCGSPVDFEDVPEGLRVTGPGYFECIGA